MDVEIWITLLGKFSARRGGKAILDHSGRKVQELVAYVLLHPGRQHRREAVASVLWPESDRDQSLRNLRQTLWVLHREFPFEPKADSLLVQEPEWLAIGSMRGLHVDTVDFEDAHRKTLTGPIRAEEPLASAVKLYRGNLLEGWYSPWCAGDRERFREMYFSMLGKLMHHHEERKEYDQAISYGILALQQDPAKEVVHRALMRLRYLGGDRTGALRQYDRCREALQKELDVAPAQETDELVEKIRNDRRGSIQAAPRPSMSPGTLCPPQDGSFRALSAPPRGGDL